MRTLPLAHFALSTCHPAALLALTPAHVLIVGIPSSDSFSAKDRAVALLWDIQLEAVLSQSDWALPNSLGTSANGSLPTFTLTRVGGSQALVLVDPPAQVQDGRAKSSVLALPFSVPEQSVLRHAMGKGALTARWLRSAVEPSASGPSSTQSKAAETQQLDGSQRKLLSRLQELVPTNEKEASVIEAAAAMDAAFAAWVDEETGRLRADWEAQRSSERAANGIEAEQKERGSESEAEDEQEHVQREERAREERRKMKDKVSRIGRVVLCSLFRI